MKERFFIDISTEDKINEVYRLFDSFEKIGDIYKHYGRSGNSKEIKYIRNIAQQINFDLNIYKERKYPKRYCLQCGNILKYGQLKFCSNSCSASFNNKLRRPMSDEVRMKISNTLSTKNSYKQKEKCIRYCLVCGKEITGKRKTYCSKECSQQRNNFYYKNAGVTKKCEYCGKEFIGSNDRKYCSIECSSLKRKEDFLHNFLCGKHIHNGNNNLPKVVRDFLYKKSNYKCEICGYEGYNIKTHNTILQIHHIDGNSKNNAIDNLQVICPNCHAKTENYMALNKGRSGRDKRYKNI
jgi:predicted nucleic acid-binding Zn ribbon protein